jgi:hypothetical protein
MARIAAFVFALTSSLTLLGTAATAETGGFYAMTLANPVAEARPIVRGQLFSCDGASCVAGQGPSRPAVVCASVAREFGPLTAFSAGGTAFDADALAKCNARAKLDTTQIVRR